jgi:hypothetical protein
MTNTTAALRSKVKDVTGALRSRRKAPAHANPDGNERAGAAC